MQVKSIAECSNESILQYFRPLLSFHLTLRSFVLSVFEWQLKTGFTVFFFYVDDRFILKQMSSMEVESFEKFGPQYFQYIYKSEKQQVQCHR